jgi:hypothetical protein
MAKRRAWGGGWGGVLVGLALFRCGSSDDGSSDADSAARATSVPGLGDALDAEPGYASGPGEEGSGARGESIGPVSEGPSPATPSSAYDVPADSAPAPEGALPLPPIEGGGNSTIQPGTLTAGAWDDSKNFERFLDYRSEIAAQQIPGLPEFDEQAHVAAAERAAAPAAHVTLDVALVIDTTGSMGDELRYLQSEFDALSSAIEAQYPQAEQRWALVVYRDEGDEYVTRSFDFEGAGETFRNRLDAQSAGGGGDYPEASDAALAAMNQLAWRSDPATARLAFWVADAPHHIERASALAAAVDVAASQDVHLYPVASSGVDELTEYVMRSAAQLTLGRYLFLTDDSGVGGEHKEPTIPCYFVTRLDDAILRMVDIEMSGVYSEPVAADVIRAGGDPADGACTLQSGQTVFAF